MAYLIVETKDKAELKLIREMLQKMRMKVFTEEEEDMALVKAMKEVDFSKTVGKEKLMKKLRGK